MRLCFYAGDPPLLEGAYGNHGIARHFVDALRKENPVVLTQRKRRSIDVGEISNVCRELPLWLHPSVGALGIRRYLPTLASILDVLIFGLWLPVLAAKLKRAKIDRIFVLCGADAWFLPNVWLLQQLGIPVDVYLVDDIEEFSDRGLVRFLKFLIRPLLGNILKNPGRNFAISPGFAEALGEKFGVTVEWLPLPAPSFQSLTGEFHSCTTARRHLVFIGAINRLYADALRDLYAEICEINDRNATGYKLVLELICYASTRDFTDSLPNQDWLVTYERLDSAAIQEHLRQAYACFLPYSFASSEQRMVSTSFSCKILEYFNCHRPILVYGPDYASIPRYFKQLELPLCATSREELQRTLGQLEEYDSADLIRKYEVAWKRFHSPEAIRSVLLGGQTIQLA